MKAFLALLLLVQMALAQDIVLKSTFSYIGQFQGTPVFAPELMDVNNDGIEEYLTSGGYLNPVDLSIFRFRTNSGQNLPYSPLGSGVLVSRARNFGQGEFYFADNINGQYCRIVCDISTGDELLNIPNSDGIIIIDYDYDGYDDFLFHIGATVQVYGIQNGNPVSPPQELDIQALGDDYIISWNSVPTATAYRVLWSSSIDGVAYTRIGYTTGTSFNHRNQASQLKGFYRVMSEDNGTGVVRMVGQTTEITR